MCLCYVLGVQVCVPEVRLHPVQPARGKRQSCGQCAGRPPMAHARGVQVCVPESRLHTKVGPCAESAEVAGMRRKVAHAVRAAHAQVSI